MKRYADVSIPVPYPILEEFAEKISCSTLNMHKPARSNGHVVGWIGRSWIPTGGVAQYLKWQEVELRECVLEAEYKGLPNDPEKSGDDYYTGGRFQFKGQTWVMTANEITLEAEK